MNDPRIECAIRDGLAERFACPVTRFAIERRIVRSYSSVLFCNLGLDTGATLRIVAKVVTGPADNMPRQQVLMARDHAINRHLQAAMPRPARHTVPTPLLFRPDLNLIVTEFMPGTRLQDLLTSACRGWPSAQTLAALEAACAGCGEWIRDFQAASAAFVADSSDFGRSLDSIEAATCVEQIAVCLDGLCKAGVSPFSAAERHELLDFVADRARRIGGGDAEIVGVHGDYFAGNVLRDGARTIGFDFVMFRKGLRLVDPSYFVFQLETLKLIPGMRPSTVQRLVRAFLRGYDAGLDADRFWQSSPAAEVFNVLHRVRRLWGMAGGRAALHRALLRRLQSAWTARRLLGQVRRPAAERVG